MKNAGLCRRFSLTCRLAHAGVAMTEGVSNVRKTLEWIALDARNEKARNCARAFSFSTAGSKSQSVLVAVAALSLEVEVGAALATVEGGSTVGFTSAAALVLGWVTVDAGISTELDVAETLLDELGMLALATTLGEAFVALPALVAAGGALATLRLGASSMAGAFATTAALSPAPFVLATVAGAAVVVSVATEAGVGAFETASSEGLMVWSRSTAPPITVAAIKPMPMPK